ncbi:9845_t:CDS:1, partial [Racocetra fulgida]
GPEKHRFTNDIIMLGTKATNKYNIYGVYKAYDNALSHKEALKSLLINKKNTVCNYLKKYPHFCAKLGSQETVDIYCNKTDNEEELTSQIAKRC